MLGFTGFLRISELLDVQIKHITQLDNRIEIFLPKSKCDQLREGNIVYISGTGTRYCPVFWLTKYLEQTKLNKESDSFLICRFAKTSKGHNVHGSKQLSYTRAREIFMENMKNLIGKQKANVTVYIHFVQAELPQPQTTTWKTV